MPADLFTTVRTEGGLLPPDLLLRVVEGDHELPGLDRSAYHLSGETLHEAINRSWNRLSGAWAAFTDARGKLPADDPGTTVTRERWLLVLFQELGYGRLAPTRPIEVAGKSYPVSHLWGETPIHLVGCGVDLDRRSPGIAGAARSSPHSLVQELLNRSEAYRWGFVSNGLLLRSLRDNASLTRKAHVEFDLHAMFDGEVYADFVLLWLACHESRVEAIEGGTGAHDCWLERWTTLAAEQGTRALDRLRDGVESAIIALGSGFLGHPANSELRDRLRDGRLTPTDYYRQLLRIVYRLIFVFAAEDRDLLLDPRADPVAGERYEHYSSTRLRRLAGRHRGSRHGDLYEALKLVFQGLGGYANCAPLGLPILGSFLWSAEATPSLDRSSLSNRDLLEAIRGLAFTSERTQRRPVDYRNLGTEELGSIYEGLLELHPDVHLDAARFTLAVGGAEKKGTGTYYTDPSLIAALLDSALDPVLDAAALQPEAAARILALRVLDPACGSGHFLIAAAHRMAGRLASARTGDPEPAPAAVREALRDVIGRCVYGVDLSEMAVELCKVSLWLEALTPGHPLSFLDGHVKRGNSLVGVTPALLTSGVPDEAFETVEGDVPAVAREMKRNNKTERTGQLSLDEAVSIAVSDALTKRAAAIAEMHDAALDDIRAIERAHAGLIGSEDYVQGRQLADAWCAAFVGPKVAGTPTITQSVLRRLRRGDSTVVAAFGELIARLRDEYHFFHWYLEFPEIFPTGSSVRTVGLGWAGGFDVVLGNPPWERVQLEEEEFFAVRHPAIAAARTAAERKRMIAALEREDPALFAAYRAALRRSSGEGHFIRHSGRYPLTGFGKFNTYAAFAETMRLLASPTGRVGVIVPTGIATDDTTKTFFADVVTSGALVSLYDFENREGIFPAVHRSTKFCLLTLAGGAGASAAAEFVFFALRASNLAEPERRFALTPADLELLNPNTRTCPIFRSRRDAELTKAIYGSVPVFVRENAGAEVNRWGAAFSQGLFNMASDSALFIRRADVEAKGFGLEGNVMRGEGTKYLPLYEAKMFHQFTHRFGDFRSRADTKGVDLGGVDDTILADPSFVPLPRYWVESRHVAEALQGRWHHDWLIGWRKICRNTDERTFIASVLPRVAVGDSINVLMAGAPPRLTACLLANLNSFAFDYVARQKLGGTNMLLFIVKQLAVLPRETYTAAPAWAGEELSKWVGRRVLELVFTSDDIAAFARDVGWSGPPFPWDPARRLQLRCELDAAFFRLYDMRRSDVEHVLTTFPIVEHAEVREFGEFRSRRLILEVFDALETTERADTAYRSDAGAAVGRT